jgi:hypothetical protein
MRRVTNRPIECKSRNLSQALGKDQSREEAKGKNTVEPKLIGAIQNVDSFEISTDRLVSIRYQLSGVEKGISNGFIRLTITQQKRNFNLGPCEAVRDFVRPRR